MAQKHRMRMCLSLVLLSLLLSGAIGAVPAGAEGMGDVVVETVRTDGFKMDYFRFGRGRQTLVILPGLSMQSVMGAADAVARAYQALTDDFTIYVIDRRRELPESYTVQDMARDTAQALEALGLDRVCLFGASQGGMMALVLAIEYPKRVEKLVLGSTAARVNETLNQTLDDWIHLAESGDVRELYLAFGAAVYPEGVFEQYREALIAAAETVTAEELKRFVILAEGMRGFDVLEDVESISCPVLVLGSTDDRVLGTEASLQIAGRLEGRKDCALFMYDGYGHAAYDTAPDYKARMRRFLLAGPAAQ